MRFGKFPEKRDSEGRMLCKWCPNLVPKGRVYFCSKVCAFEVQIRRDASFLRARTKERDHGVCAACGIDTAQLRRILKHATRALIYWMNLPRYEGNAYWFNLQMKSAWGYQLWRHVNDMTKWEADHIVEVVDGGAPYLENIQTLCLPCHKAKTKAMHGERAAKRRAQKQPPLTFNLAPQATHTLE